MAKKRSLEDWMGYIAVLVAVIAAGAAIYEARINRQHQAISVWPYLQMHVGQIVDADELERGANAFDFNIQNQGVGPAIVEYVNLRRKGEPYESWYTMVREALKDIAPDRVDLYRTIGEAALEPGEVIAAGDNQKVIFSKSVELARVLARDFYQNVEVEVCFCSLYNECWELTFPKSRPVRDRLCRREDI